MNPGQRYFIATVRRQAKFMRAGAGARVPYFASHLEIELTNRCNLRCPFCLTAHLRRPRTQLPLVLLQRVFRHLRRHNLHPRVSFCGDGEMLLHPRLADAVRLAKDAGCHVSLITNGVLCDDRRTRELLAAGLDRIQFSLDTIDARVYARMRPAHDGRKNFRTVMRNVLNFLQLNRAAGEPVHVSVMSVQTGENIAGRRRFAAYWRRLPVHNVFLSPLYTLGGNLKESYRAAGGAEFRGRDADKPVCVIPFIALCLKADGTLLACSHDTHAVYPLARLRAGRRFDLRRIWNGRKVQALRRAHLQNRYQGMVDCGLDCRACNAPLLGNALREYAVGVTAAKVRVIAGSTRGTGAPAAADRALLQELRKYAATI